MNHEYLLDGPEARIEYLQRARSAFLNSDWRALSYALMSTHTHFSAIAGLDAFADLSRPLHSGFVPWLNTRQGRLGAGIANRPATREVALSHSARLIAYHHNNPVRAGVASRAAETDWTSHRFYAEGASPDWLHVELGLELAGFDSSTLGRQGFSELVDRSKHDTWEITDEQLLGIRRVARHQFGSAVEIGQPQIDAEIKLPLWCPDTARPTTRWRGSLDSIARASCRYLGIHWSALSSTNRQRSITRTRRLFILVAREHAGRNLTEAAAYLGISVQAASKQALRADSQDRTAAQEIAQVLGIIKLKS